MVEGCPAFADGCPFLIQDTSVFKAILPSCFKDASQTAAERCPAFNGGCPFKATDSVESLYNGLSELPSTHRIGHDSSAARAVEETFHMVHERSKVVRATIDAPCPVFATSCPFKTLTSDGELLVQELDSVVDSWGLAETPTESPPEELGEPLSKTLKSGTRFAHRAAENVRFVRDFLKGKVTRESYVELLRSLLHVYSALESALRRLPEEFRHCDFEVLRRTESLAADLLFYSGVDQAGLPSPATAQYVERLQRLAVERPLLLLAHAYTRYLGDLSGGQIFARAAAKTYGLGPGEGVAFYKFEGIGDSAQDVKAFKRQYRDSLDALRLSASEADALVEEAGVAFIMNMRLFEERDVAAGHLRCVRETEEMLALARANTSALGFQRAYAQRDPAAAKCPFLPSTGGQDSAPAAPARCAWPFLWLHDPLAASRSHPAKNIGSVLTIFGLGYAGWHYPRATAAGLLGSMMVGVHVAPAKWRRHK